MMQQPTFACKIRRWFVRWPDGIKNSPPTLQDDNKYMENAVSGWSFDQRS
jgi:hypothetical protein